MREGGGELGRTREELLGASRWDVWKGDGNITHNKRVHVALKEWVVVHSRAPAGDETGCDCDRRGFFPSEGLFLIGPLQTQANFPSFPPTPLLLAPRSRVPACGACVLVSRVLACALPRLLRTKPSTRVLGRFSPSAASLPPRASLPPPLRGHAMAAPSSQQGAREPPPPGELAALYSLTDKVVSAGMLNRHARVAELSASAALKAEALFTNDSLVVAHLRLDESKALVNQAASASGAELVALLHRSWSALSSVIGLLQRRLATNTLLPGTVRKEDSDYHAHVIATTYAAQTNAVQPPPAVMQAMAPTIGLKVLLNALHLSLSLLPVSFHSLWPAAQQKMVESFVRAHLSCRLATDASPDVAIFVQVFQALDIIPLTAGLKNGLAVELDLVAFIAEHMSPQQFEPVFCAAVLRKWQSDAVSSVLRARGVLQAGVAFHEQLDDEFEARQRADVAKHGLRDCALPSCSKTEKTVKEFAHCSGCRSVVYCCAEHQGLHWTKHKKACREKEAARLAAEEGGDGAEGAGASAT